MSNNKKIYDYCGGVKVKSDWQLTSIEINKGVIIETPQQKICRYFISKNGIKLIKRHKTDGREIQIESGKWMQTIFNKKEAILWEDIDQEYYIHRIYKEIHNIDKIIKKQFQQLQLF